MQRRNKRKKQAVGRRPQQLKREVMRIDGRSVEVILRTNPRARGFIVKVDPSTGEITVVSPSARSFSAALEFARKEREWIAGRLAEVPSPVTLEIGGSVLYRGIEHVIRVGERGSGPVYIDREAAVPTLRVHGAREHATRRVLDWLKRQARRRIDESAANYAEMLRVRPRAITIRDTTSRWGSCSTTRNLSFSWRLILAPSYVLEYVVAHEVAHLREMNHEPRFWRLVDVLVPHAARAQQWLSDHGALLHRYAPRTRPLPQ